eukprot:418608-Amphidinium_carterae.2
MFSKSPLAVQVQEGTVDKASTTTLAALIQTSEVKTSQTATALFIQDTLLAMKQTHVATRRHRVPGASITALHMRIIWETLAGIEVSLENKRRPQTLSAWKL